MGQSGVRPIGNLFWDIVTDLPRRSVDLSALTTCAELSTVMVLVTGRIDLDPILD